MGGSQPDASAAQAALGADRIRHNQNPLDPKYQHIHDPNVSETQLAAEAEAKNIRDAQEQRKNEEDAKAEQELNAQLRCLQCAFIIEMETQQQTKQQDATMGDRERGFMASKAALNNRNKTLVPDHSAAAETAPSCSVVTPSQLGAHASELKTKRDIARAKTQAP